jgi:cardiolipin synthase
MPDRTPPDTTVPHPAPPDAPPEVRWASTRRMFEEAIGAPFTTGNSIEPLKNGDAIFPAMLAAIEAAERSVELLTFVYWRGEIARRFAGTLAEKARQGVQVRVLLDAYGASPMRKELIETMTGAGVDLRWFRPLRRLDFWSAEHRTHRKVMVVDGRVGFTGGVGIAEEWCGDARDETEWRDTHFRIRGPAVRGLRAAFMGNWAEALNEAGAAQPLADLLEAGEDEVARPGTAEVQVVRSSARIAWSDVAAMMELAIASARRSLRICTAYFTPDETTAEQLAAAARRGVAVEIMIPWPHMDMRVSQLAGADAIAPLLRAGVGFQVFQPTMYHAKQVLIDDDVAVIGSANFNRRSAEQDDEVCLVCRDPALVAALSAHWEEDLARCAEVDLHRWRRRGAWQRLKESAARVVRRAV